LDLQKVRHLLAKLELADLSVSNDTDDLAVLLDALKLLLDSLGLLGGLLGVLGECLLLGLVPVLVESALDILREMARPDGGKGAETVGSGDIADDTDHNDRRGLEDGDSLDRLLLVELRTRALDFANDVGHASLVADESGEVRRKGSIVLGEGSNATTVMSGSLLGKILKRALSRCFEFTVRHF